MPRPLMCFTILVLFLGAWGAALRPAAASADPVRPLLTWDVLRDTHYTPLEGIAWPESVTAADEQWVRLEGYIMPNYGSQDPADLLLTAVHPRSLFCGPTDMTALVQVYLPGFNPKDWPLLPVEVVGRFSVSKRPENLQAIYRLYGSDWRPLRRWVQDFPGVVDEELAPDDLDP